MNSEYVSPKFFPEDRHTVLIVDDMPDNLALMSGLLKDTYRIKVATSGKKALEIANATNPDLILLDLVMPDMDGYQVCGSLKNNAATRDIPVIFLTASTSSEDEERGLELGAVDYITKPVTPGIVRARVSTHLQLKASADFLRDKSAYLAAEVARQIEQIQAIQDVTIQAMASLAETRDNETGYHICRTQHYVRVLADYLREHPRFAPYLQQKNVIETLFKSAPLHDIGKVGIPDNILLKPGKLTADEFEVMKTHAALGYNSIERAERILGHKTDFLVCAKEISHSHHEKWDGSGYPQGLSGDDIPISARLMALADVYDAMASRRIYKSGMSHDVVRDTIIQGRMRHFDSDVVDAFLAEEDKFLEIFTHFSDKHDASSQEGRE
ncbi:MAG: two-component system response regulator [Betaproteobacteria bacterium]|nr:two-component system response regulator [Betaproteobacteria bacterium]